MLQIRAPHPWEPIVEHLSAHHGLSVWWEICPNWNGKPSEGFELGNKAIWFHWNKISVEKSVSVQFSHSVVSDSLRPHEPQHTRSPCPSQIPGVHPNPCPLSRWCHPTISSSVVPFSSCIRVFPSIRVFSNESALHIRWPEYWSCSFNISPSNEHPGMISFRMDWLDLLAVQGSL